MIMIMMTMIMLMMMVMMIIIIIIITNKKQHKIPKIQAPTEIRTHTLALVADALKESRRAKRCASRRVRHGFVLTAWIPCTLRQKLQLKLVTEANHSLLTLGRTVLVLSLYRQASGHVATTLPLSKSLVYLDRHLDFSHRGRQLGLWFLLVV